MPQIDWETDFSPFWCKESDIFFLLSPIVSGVEKVLWFIVMIKENIIQNKMVKPHVTMHNNLKVKITYFGI